MLFVITGNGKGKTTSSLGMVARAEGQGLKCAVLQFIKSKDGITGECMTFSKLGVPWECWGEGFTWAQESMEKTKDNCEKGWASFKSKVESGMFQLIVLDEFTYTLKYNLLDEDEVMAYLEKAKEKLHIVISGRDADRKLVELADTVSSVEEVKHHFKTKNMNALKGIEF